MGMKETALMVGAMTAMAVGNSPILSFDEEGSPRPRKDPNDPCQKEKIRKAEEKRQRKAERWNSQKSKTKSYAPDAAPPMTTSPEHSPAAEQEPSTGPESDSPL